jgi:hypothetical protein
LSPLSDEKGLSRCLMSFVTRRLGEAMSEQTHTREVLKLRVPFLLLSVFGMRDFSGIVRLRYQIGACFVTNRLIMS